MADNHIENLNPQTTKEWLMVLNGKIDEIRKSQSDMDGQLKKLISDENDWRDNHEKEEAAQNTKIERQTVILDNLEKRVSKWDSINSIGTVIAIILGAFGISISK